MRVGTDMGDKSPVVIREHLIIKHAIFLQNLIISQMHEAKEEEE